MNIIAAMWIALSFLTVLPAPRVEWTPARLRYFPLALPAAGAAAGAIGAAAFALLARALPYQNAVRAALTTLAFLAVTGGLHMDGLMDTCDAVFSRRGRKERLEILSDPRAGSFAVMGCVLILLLKTAAFYDLCALARAPLAQLCLIPVYSRFGAGFLFYLPFAKEDGLARALGGSRAAGDRFFLAAGCACLTAFSLAMGWILAPALSLALSYFYSRWCVRAFGGVTGDLMGAYMELSDTMMLLTLVLEVG